MCMGGGAKMPAAPPAPPANPTAASPDVQNAVAGAKSKALAAGASQSVLTSPQGLLGQQATQGKSLLGG